MIKIVYNGFAFVGRPAGPLDRALSGPFYALIDFGGGPHEVCFEGFFDRAGRYFERITCLDGLCCPETWLTLPDRAAEPQEAAA